MVRNLGRTYALTYGPPDSTTTAQEYGFNPLEGHEAGDDCTAWSVETWIQIQVKSQAFAWASGLGFKEV